eukprot:scaffold1712_cov82-Phaeocystis_antarctica.AAC.5
MAAALVEAMDAYAPRVGPDEEGRDASALGCVHQQAGFAMATVHRFAGTAGRPAGRPQPIECCARQNIAIAARCVALDAFGVLGHQQQRWRAAPHSRRRRPAEKRSQLRRIDRRFEDHVGSRLQDYVAGIRSDTVPRDHLAAEQRARANVLLSQHVCKGFQLGLVPDHCDRVAHLLRWVAREAHRLCSTVPRGDGAVLDVEREEHDEPARRRRVEKRVQVLNVRGERAEQACLVHPEDRLTTLRTGR